MKADTSRMRDDGIKDIRYANFLTILREFGDKDGERGAIRRLAKASDTDESYISQLKNREKGLGRTVAARLEHAAGRKPGWMDKEHAPHEPRDEHERIYFDIMMELYRKAPSRARRVLKAMLDEGSDS